MFWPISGDQVVESWMQPAGFSVLACGEAHCQCICFEEVLPRDVEAGKELSSCGFGLL